MNRRKLSEVCTVIVPMRDKPKEFVGKGEGIPWCRIEDIEGKFLHCSKSSRYVTNECIEDMNLKVFPAGTVLCAVTGASIGKYAVTTAELITNQTFAGLVCGDEIYNEYLYYYIKLQTKALVNHSVGCAQEYITRETLENLTIPVYPYEEQIQLVSILKNIDDKISNNNAINAELEALAKTIYDYWFLQFEFPNEEGLPYKSSGGKMVWSEELKREIPEGWGVKSIFDVADVVYGYPFSTECFSDTEGIPVIRIRDILGNSTSAFTSEKVESRYLTKEKDLLIGMDGIFHMNFWTREGNYVNQRVVRIRTDSLISVLQIYYEILPFIKAREQNVARSTVGHLSDKDMKNLKILVPSTDKYYDTFDTLLSKICINKRENEELSALRDWLLPMLMNGQVGFKEEVTST